MEVKIRHLLNSINKFSTACDYACIRGSWERRGHQEEYQMQKEMFMENLFMLFLNVECELLVQKLFAFSIPSQVGLYIVEVFMNMLFSVVCG